LQAPRKTTSRREDETPFQWLNITNRDALLVVGRRLTAAASATTSATAAPETATAASVIAAAEAAASATTAAAAPETAATAAEATLHFLGGFFKLRGADRAVAIAVRILQEAHHLRRDFIRLQGTVAVAVELLNHVGAAEAAARAAAKSTRAAKAAATAAHLRRHGRQLLRAQGAVAVGIGAFHHRARHERRQLVAAEFAVAVRVGFHKPRDHLRRVAAAATAAADAGLFGRDAAVLVGVERLKRRDGPPQLGRADDVVAVGIEGREQQVLAAAASAATAESAAGTALAAGLAAKPAALPAASAAAGSTAAGGIALVRGLGVGAKRPPAALASLSALRTLSALGITPLGAAIAAAAATASFVARILGNGRGRRHQAQAECEEVPSHVSTPRKRNCPVR
jgi:hypothetical protein